MGKRGRSQKKDSSGRSNKRRISHDDYIEDTKDMDDDIDAFHKQRDIVPLDVNDDVRESSEDDEVPVLDDEDIDYDDEDDDDDDDIQDTGLAAKILRQQKYLRDKFGEPDHEMSEDEEETDEERKGGWGGAYYGGDNKDELQSSDDEAAKLEEIEVIKKQKERAKVLTEEDFGLKDFDEDGYDRELTLEEISTKAKGLKKSLPSKETTAGDLNVLSKEERMSSAPELVGLLSELNGAAEQLETKVNPLLNKVKAGEVVMEGGIHYLELKQLLLLTYCQAIAFYLLLKSEGHQVLDHPVIARLVEIKGLLDKVKGLDGNLPAEFEDFMKKNFGPDFIEDAVTVNDETALPSDDVAKAPSSFVVLANAEVAAEHSDAKQLVKVKHLSDSQSKGKHKHKNGQVGVQSTEMLKLRASLEEKLKQKGILNNILSKPYKVRKHLKPANGQLETFDDFDDVTTDLKRTHGNASSTGSIKLSQLVTAKTSVPKVISGDDDLPKRDDIGERRRKHELRVLSSAGVKSEDDGGEELDLLEADGASDTENDDADDRDVSEDEFYKQVKEKREARLAAKAEIYARAVPALLLPETVDGKRQITSQIEKNRALTRPRNKLNKNPRRKYRIKHSKAETRRKGQVRDMRKPTGQYGGESTGINTGVSRSTRF